MACSPARPIRIRQNPDPPNGCFLTLFEDMHILEGFCSNGQKQLIPADFRQAGELLPDVEWFPRHVRGVMKIQVGGLSDGVHDYSFRVTPDELGLPSGFPDGVEIKATLEKTSRQFLLKASIATTAEVLCDRCVAPFRRPLGSRYQMHYVWDESDAERIDASEVQVVLPGQTVIDLADDVRQTVLLSFPLKNVCREDCRGLCSQCGRNLNEGSCDCKETHVDGRWDKLKELQDNNSKQAG
jgi:uncharacterized protein